MQHGVPGAPSHDDPLRRLRLALAHALARQYGMQLLDAQRLMQEAKHNEKAWKKQKEAEDAREAELATAQEEWEAAKEAAAGDGGAFDKAPPQATPRCT